MYIRISALLVLALALAVPMAHAGRKDKGPKNQTPPTANPAVTLEESPQDAGPKAPKLFPDGLPIAHQQLPDGVASLSAQSCNGCHYEIHDSWEKSGHRSARTGEPFATALAATGDSPLCTSCHTPLLNQQQQLVREYTGGPLGEALTDPNESWDATLSAEGVTCAACHVRDEVVIGSRPASGAPHPVAVSEELGESSFCASCHQLTWEGAEQPLYNTYGEWAESNYAAAGVQCQDCHMPPRSGLVTAGSFAAHRDHGFDAAQGRALTLLLDIPPNGVVRGEVLSGTLTVMNTGAGHAFPTGSPFSSAVLQIAVVDAEGKDSGEPWESVLERPTSMEPPYGSIGEDTTLQPGETRVLPFTLTPSQKSEGGRGAIEVRVLRQSPTGERRVSQVQRIPLAVN